MAHKNAPKLTLEQKWWIIDRLACYDPPSDVKAEFEKAFGVTLGRDAVMRYDPTNAMCKIGPDLRERFARIREEFNRETDRIPVAQRSYRLRRLQAMHDRAFAMGNHKLAADLLEQAAKEAGGAFTNIREVQGKLKHEHEGDLSFKVDEQRASLEELIEQALSATAPGAGATAH